MSESKLSKYRVVSASTVWELQEKMNALAELGYIHKDLVVSGRVEDPFLVEIMSLGENDYSNVTQIKDIVPELADDAINSGWEPISMSLSTKFIRFVRRKK